MQRGTNEEGSLDWTSRCSFAVVHRDGNAMSALCKVMT